MITWTNDDQVLLRLLATLDHKEASNWTELYKSNFQILGV